MGGGEGGGPPHIVPMALLLVVSRGVWLSLRARIAAMIAPRAAPTRLGERTSPAAEGGGRDDLIPHKLGPSRQPPSKIRPPLSFFRWHSHDSGGSKKMESKAYAPHQSKGLGVQRWKRSTYGMKRVCHQRGLLHAEHLRHPFPRTHGHSTDIL